MFLFLLLMWAALPLAAETNWALTYDPATAKTLGITLTPDPVAPPSTADTWALSYDPAAAQTLTITLSPKSAPPPPPPPPPPSDWDTEILGQSQTTQWGPYFKSPGWQFRIKTGSGYMNWMNATDSIWTAPEKLYSSDGTPIVAYADIERVIITVGKAPQDVGVSGTYESLLDKTIATVRTKYPNLKEIRLQPLAAGPNKALCSSGGQNVLTTVNLPAIEKAIATLTDKYTDVTIGALPLVNNCSEFADATGHLTDPTGRQDIAAKVSAFYGTTTPPPPPPPPTGSGAIASDIYVVDDGDADFARALASDVVKGALVRVQWTQLETSEGKYSFTNLCSKITQAHALGKGVALVNYPLPPTWLVSKVPTSDRWTLPLGARSVATIVPWNTTLLSAMQKLAEAEANYVCGGYPIKNHPALRQVDDTVAGALSVRDVPTGATLSQMTEAVTSSVKIWHAAYPGNYAHFMGIFPLGRTSTAVADATTIGKAVLALYPDEHFFMENWDIKGPGGTMADPLKLAKYKIIQACNYFSQPDRIKCSGSGVSGNTPGAAYDKILKPMGGVMSVQIYPDDILYPAYAAELKAMAAELAAK